jgi:hypothetical protein
MTHDTDSSPDMSADATAPDSAAGETELTTEQEDPTETGAETRAETQAETQAETGPPAEGTSSTDGEQQLVPQEVVLDYRARWEAIQQGFVDDPRRAVTEADALVDDVLKKLSTTFEEQHDQLEGQWNDGEPDTEDLRSALRKYRDFFDRLLAI